MPDNFGLGAVLHLFDSDSKPIQETQTYKEFTRPDADGEWSEGSEVDASVTQFPQPHPRMQSARG